MISELRIENFAIVEKLDVRFAAGLNVVTGETGAGKSILIGALNLLLGARADREVIRAGAPDCRVEAVFLPGPAAAGVAAVLEAAGLPPMEEGRLVLRRTIAGSGAGRAYVNDGAATVQTLRRMAAGLVDLHGPHDQQSLLDPSFQLALLDAFGKLDAARGRCAEAFRAWREARTERETLDADPATLARERDLLAFQADEIEQAGLRPEDGDDLIREHAECANAGRLLELGGQLEALWEESDASVFDGLARSQQVLGEMERLLPEASVWREEARAVTVQVQELARAVRDRIQRIEADAGRLQWLEERMARVQRLKRKYGETIEAILAQASDARARLEAIDRHASRLAEADARIEAARAGWQAAAAALHDARTPVARRLARAIRDELRALGFARCGFEVRLAPRDPGPTGGDDAGFEFAPNVGEPMRSLRDIASSGEISRLMLAVKGVLAEHDRVPVLVFDEIDANIGGETANVVGARMRALARAHQVICITHLPQVAVYGNHHLAVRKQASGGRTVTGIAEVQADERGAEIARMLGGETLTPVTRTHAQAMLRAAAK